MHPPRGERLGGGVTPDLVEYLIVWLPGPESLSVVANALVELLEAGVIGILDLVVVERTADGGFDVLEIDNVESLGPLARALGPLDSLLSAHDIELASRAFRPSSAGLVLVTEDRWARPLSAAAASAGGQIIASERISAARIEAALAARIEEGGSGS
jgi:hypothetical protein